jgi:lysophospholipase L1-like esterase
MAANLRGTGCGVLAPVGLGFRDQVFRVCGAWHLTAAQAAARKGPRGPLKDLHLLFPAQDRLLPFPQSKNDAAAMTLWDDYLHLSPAGYDRMGEIVYEALKVKLEK